jgi:Flp pilus assembly protein TadG
MTIRSLRIVKALRGDGGQALVETAMTLPLLALMLLGAFEFSRVAYSAIEVTNAARAAAQYGAMNGGGFLDTSGMMAAANADAGNLNNGLSWVSGYPSVACSCSGTGTASCAAGTNPSGCTTSQLMVTVNVQMKYQITSLLKVPGFPTTYTVYGTASQGLLQ